MPGYPGFDILAYPGDDSVAWLKDNTNLSWCGYYLAPAPSHDDESWMGQRATLTTAGWGLAPTYVGQQLAGPGSHVVTGPQGQLDGADAAQLMTQEGFAPGSFVYLDLEDGPPFTAPRTDYVNAWVTAVQAAGFQAGIYCSHGLAEDVHSLCPQARIWAYKVTTTATHPFPGSNFPDSAPAGSGYTGSYMWQLGQNCRIDVQTNPAGSFVVDLSSAVAPDPSA